MAAALRSGLRRRVIAGAAVAVLLALAAAFLAYRAGSGSASANADKLSVASAALPHTALLQIAAAKGYFAEQGLELTIVPTTHGKVAIELLLAGKVDLATAAEVPFVLQVLAGQPLAMAASMLSIAEEKAVIARRDHGIASTSGLQKKKIGVTFGTSGEYFLWAFMIRSKLPNASVTLVDVAPGRMVEVLAAGAVDAVATWQPLVHQVQAQLKENAVTFADSDAYTELHILVGYRDFLEARSPAIEKLVRGLLKAEQFARSQPAAAQQLVAERLKIDPLVLASTWAMADFSVNLRQSHLITLEDEAKWAMARGYTAKGPVPNFLPNLYLDALYATRPDRMTVAR